MARETPIVNYYELLGLPANAETERVRKTISALYLEAQQNLDHRSFRKRFYYAELYEIHLPQARLTLLDAKRRAAYDKYLLHRDGGKPAESTPDPFAELDEIEWPEESENANSKTPPQSIEFKRAALEKARMDAEQVARRRDFKRRALIKNELVAAGLRWGVGGGLASVFAASAALLIINGWIRQAGTAPLGLSPQAFNILAFALTLAGSLLFARHSLRQARRRIIAVLSRMPYEELLMRCGR